MNLDKQLNLYAHQTDGKYRTPNTGTKKPDKSTQPSGEPDLDDRAEDCAADHLDRIHKVV